MNGKDYSNENIKKTIKYSKVDLDKIDEDDSVDEAIEIDEEE